MITDVLPLAKVVLLASAIRESSKRKLARDPTAARNIKMPNITKAPRECPLKRVPIVITETLTATDTLTAIANRGRSEIDISLHCPRYTPHKKKTAIVQITT